MSLAEGYKRNYKKEMGIGIVITIWQEITIQSLYCDLDMGTNTVMYNKCSHVPNLIALSVLYLALPKCSAPDNLLQSTSQRFPEDQDSSRLHLREYSSRILSSRLMCTDTRKLVTGLRVGMARLPPTNQNREFSEANVGDISMSYIV